MEVAAVFTLEETFDQLTAQAVANPADELAFDALRTHLAAVSESGQVRQVMEMSMVLGALACLHPHMEDLANEMGELYGGIEESECSSHGQPEEPHDTKKCRNCRAGKQCSRK